MNYRTSQDIKHAVLAANFWKKIHGNLTSQELRDRVGSAVELCMPVFQQLLDRIKELEDRCTPDPFVVPGLPNSWVKNVELMPLQGDSWIAWYTYGEQQTKLCSGEVSNYRAAITSLARQLRQLVTP